MSNQYFFSNLDLAKDHMQHAERTTPEQLNYYLSISAQIPPQTINGQAWRLISTKTANVFYKE